MKKVLFLLGALFSFNAFAANLEEGKQYVQVSQTASAQPEVIEFLFSHQPYAAFHMICVRELIKQRRFFNSVGLA
jgi:protein dithiol oxidoreductase (disulfide-forming)